MVISPGCVSVNIHPGAIGFKNTTPPPCPSKSRLPIPWDKTVINNIFGEVKLALKDMAKAPNPTQSALHHPPQNLSKTMNHPHE